MTRMSNINGYKIESGAYLCGADLCGADLRGADLCGADLCEASLCEADLSGADLHRADLHEADLRGANLRGADLSEADLCGADLSEADLCGADLCGADLRGAIGILVVGPIGSRKGFVYAVEHGDTYICQVGCQWFSLDEFAQQVTNVNGDNKHGRDYQNVIAFLRAMEVS